MCGIIGITAFEGDVAGNILEGLKRLEYRGYDSAGIATAANGTLHRARAQGKLINLSSVLDKSPLTGACGIGHTRWATHGAPSEINAHPHATDKVATVHNGIIENFRELREQLIAKGYKFVSETDSEVIPVLVTYWLDTGLPPEQAAQKAIAELKGAFAFALIFRDMPGTIIAARRGAPLAIGYGRGGMFLGSDALALAHLATEISYLEDGDWAVLTPDSAAIFDETGNSVTRPKRPMGQLDAISKGNYRHYMQKEIYEQPAVVAETLSSHYNLADESFHLPPLPFALENIRRIHLVACGTSSYAALVARYWIETIARIPAEVDIASEFRYREPILEADGLTIVISQSGETADTLAALRYAKQFQPVLAIVNVAESSIAREANAVLHTQAGPEIGVASTKAFTTQLAVLACLSLCLAKARNACEPQRLQELANELLTVPGKLADALHLDEAAQTIAAEIAKARDVLYLGRGTSYAIAHEGALKLKEISYIHAEAYAAGEMKHGPIALIDDSVPIIAIAPYDELFEKTASNLQEAAARGGKIILLSDAKGVKELGYLATAALTLPATGFFSAPLVYALPVQQLAYHTALVKGTDVDQPRNLAKSVTVE